MRIDLRPRGGQPERCHANVWCLRRAADIADHQGRAEEATTLRAEADELANLDPGLLQLALMGATLAPVALPQVVRRITGLDPADPNLRTRYEQQLRRIVRHLADISDVD